MTSCDTSGNEGRLVVLIEGPAWGDADFYGNWLIFAAKAQQLLEQVQKDDANFRRKLGNIQVVGMIEFGILATVFVSQLNDQHISFLVEAESQDLVEFVLMTKMGFFEITGDRYQMVLPANLDIDVLKAAIAELANTEDDDWIHPECLVVSMTRREAKTMQARLHHIDEAQRLADRAALLFLDR